MGIDAELIHGAVTLAAVLVGGAISAGVSLIQARRQLEGSRTVADLQATHARSLMELQTTLARQTERSRQRREGIGARLALQRAALDDYLRLVAKHQATEYHGPTEGIGKGLARRKRESAEAHLDAVTMYGKLLVAFGDAGFAHQASDTLEAVSAVRGNPMLETVTSALFGSQYVNRMVDAIRASELQLRLPRPAVVPEPLIPDEVYNKERKRILLRDVAQKHGFDPNRIDEILATVDAQKKTEPESDA